VQFAVSGGSGVGFVWTIPGNGSGAVIDAATGAYVAGAKAGTTDTVSVRDSLGNSATATVHVTSGGTPDAGPTSGGTPDAGPMSGGDGGDSSGHAQDNGRESSSCACRVTSPDRSQDAVGGLLGALGFLALCAARLRARPRTRL
jgi:hypothetical protein